MISHRLITLTLAAILAVTVAATTRVKVACIGNSITYGYKLPDPARDSYPSQLQRLLGDGYEIGNFGHSGATLLRKGHRPYTSLPEFKAALDFRPDIAVIHLGVNDTDPRDWPEYGDEFIGDYLAIIDSLRAANSDVRIIVANLTPLRADHHRFVTGTRDWRLKIRDAIAIAAREAEVELIDFDTPLRDRQELIFDAIHPDTDGAGLLAETVRGAITGNYGGLWLPEVYGSGMVVQRNRPLTFRGRADAGSPIELKIDNRTYRSVTDNRGEWAITTHPLTSGPTYTLAVTDGKTDKTFTDILAGEVWIASGQSNMEFPLASAVGGAEALASCADPQLRIYDMKPAARTDNVEWSDSIITLMNSLEHYRPARWQKIDEGNAASLSAVAYFFARQLRDSLGVPVGIIANAVGGSPTESWVDINTLEAQMPGILLNPLTNDYLQKWVQQRIARNTGNRPGARHPYLPSYLFAAGIRPLAGFPVAGVIWYQGESNAHNIELHEKLFSMLAESWRREFRNPDLPIYFVQLSGIARPSWPAFRNSQRLLARSVPNTAMAMSHDLGDSLDVHPRDKQPVGRRLARLALHRTYGFDIEDSGPQLRSAMIAGPGTMRLTFDHAEGLATADGASPRTFEIATSEGLFVPAEARIIDSNTIELTNMNVSTPRLVRYAWQPFTRANLVNGAGLPASTFSAEADNAAMYDQEPGIERGVSAPFFGRIGNRFIIAGGANFPCDDPFAPAAEKKLYQGIYAADTATLEWQRIGSLPKPMAYGATAAIDSGLVLVGTDRSVRLLKADGSLSELPSMPAAVDNAAAAAIGNTVYVCGGNVDGKPSRELWALDFDSGKWKKLRSMPGNPRVQPAMAASDGRLYVWGGFAGRHDGKEATLETSGLCFVPSTGKWSPLPAPTDASGNEVSLGGGVAVKLPDGRIAACGGVNKEVFLAALQNQPADYLEHPVDWYRFNRDVFIFDPHSNSWVIALSDPDAARAGAAAVVTDDSALLIYGGELKPRVRTSETMRVKI